MSEDFLTPVEVADILKIKKNTVYEMIKRGDLAASKLGKQLRIRQEDLDAYLGQKSQGRSLSAAPTIVNFSSGMQTDAASSGTSIIICGQDTILDKLCDRMNETDLNVSALRSRKGSYNALYSLYNRQANIATCHLWDSDTNTYNLPFIPKLLPGMPVRIFHLLNRVQGFYVAKGNPKNIKDFKDLTRRDITFVNREPGCGTRILLDGKLMKAGISASQIRGYYTEKASHLECATAVAMRSADVALGNERTSYQIPDIDFIPLQTERYDMVIPTELCEKPAYQKLIEIIRSEDFRSEVKAMGGYDVTDMGKEITP